METHQYPRPTCLIVTLMFFHTSSGNKKKGAEMENEMENGNRIGNQFQRVETFGSNTLPIEIKALRICPVALSVMAQLAHSE